MWKAQKGRLNMFALRWLFANLKPGIEHPLKERKFFFLFMCCLLLKRSLNES
jgi:hypothetical protein